MSNNSNPHSLDGEQVLDKGLDNNVVRATVIDVLPDVHSVRVNPRGDNAPIITPVLTPTYGSQTLPSEGERVMLLYVEENTPICLGSIYLLDGEDPPADADGDLRIGNGEEFIRFNEGGGIDSSTDLGGSYDDEAAQDAVADLITGGANVSVAYDDANNTLTIDTSKLTEEEVEDTVSTLLTGGTGVSLSYDDANDALTIDGFSGSHNDLTDVGADDHHNQQHGNEDHDADYVDSAGDSMSGNLNMSGNSLGGVENTTFANSSNDFWRINDASGGTNSSPHTARFDDRDLRYYAGTGVGTVWKLNQDGSVEYPVGPVGIGADPSTAKTSTDLLVEGNISQIELNDTRVSNSGRYWFRNNSGNLYFLQDRDGDGDWESPHPMRIYSDGHVEFGFTPDIDGHDIVSSSTGTYDIQKNGTDGNGIINFKT